MADLSITVGQVVKSSAAKVYDGTAAASITQGQACAVVGTSVVLCAANHGTAGYSSCKGIALNAAASGQPVRLATQDTALTLGTSAAMTPGKIYVVSNTAGGIMPIDDLSTVASSTSRISILGVASSAGNLYLKILNSGTALTS